MTQLHFLSIVRSGSLTLLRYRTVNHTSLSVAIVAMIKMFWMETNLQYSVSTRYSIIVSSYQYLQYCHNLWLYYKCYDKIHEFKTGESVIIWIWRMCIAWWFRIMILVYWWIWEQSTGSVYFKLWYWMESSGRISTIHITFGQMRTVSAYEWNGHIRQWLEKEPILVRPSFPDNHVLMAKLWYSVLFIWNCLINVSYIIMESNCNITSL